MIARIVNTALKAKLNETWPDLKIMPVTGYNDSDLPFVLYYEFPVNSDPEKYWLRKSVVRYTAFDVDVSVCMDVSIEIEKYLNIGDDVATIHGDITYVDPEYRLQSISYSGGGLNVPPSIRDGFYPVSAEFDMVYNLI